MASQCKKCGNKDKYNFALNIGLCNSCIGSELGQLQAENKRLKVALDRILTLGQLEAREKEFADGILLDECAKVADQALKDKQ